MALALKIPDLVSWKIGERTTFAYCVETHSEDDFFAACISGYCIMSEKLGTYDLG
jgi:hypothetical protein